jgi:hypothetical protein
MAQPNQFMFPRLELRILNSFMDPKTGNIQGRVCSDDISWKKGDKVCRDYSIGGYDCSDVGDNGVTAFKACKVACNSCPGDVKMKRDLDHTYNRLPSPVEEISDPWASNIIQTDGNWKPGETHNISGNPEFLDKMDDLEEKIDNIRKSMPEVKCLCSDLKATTDDKDKVKTKLQPYRCGNVSELLRWDEIEKWTDPDSKDTDVRYKVKCVNGDGEYNEEAINKNLKDKQLVYNCTGQRWETRPTGHKKGKFTPYDLKKHGIVKCKKDKPCSSFKTQGDCPSLQCSWDKKCIDKKEASGKAGAAAAAAAGAAGAAGAAHIYDPFIGGHKITGRFLLNENGEGKGKGLRITQAEIDKNHKQLRKALVTDFQKRLTTELDKSKIKVKVPVDKIQISKVREGSLEFTYVISLESDKHIQQVRDSVFKLRDMELTELKKLTGKVLTGKDIHIPASVKLTLLRIDTSKLIGIQDNQWKLLAIYGGISAIAIVISILSNDRNIWGLKAIFLVALPFLYLLMMYINNETKTDDIRRKLMWVFSGVVICIMYALISGQKMKTKAFSDYQKKATGILGKLGQINPLTIITTTAGIGTSISGLLGIIR